MGIEQFLTSQRTVVSARRLESGSGGPGGSSPHDKKNGHDKTPKPGPLGHIRRDDEDRPIGPFREKGDKGKKGPKNGNDPDEGGVDR